MANIKLTYYKNKRGGKTMESSGHASMPSLIARVNHKADEENILNGQLQAASSADHDKVRNAKVYNSKQARMLADGYVTTDSNKGVVNNRKDSDSVNSQADRLRKAILSERKKLVSDKTNRTKRGSLNAATRRRVAELDARLDRVEGTQNAYNDYHSLGAKAGSAG